MADKINTPKPESIVTPVGIASFAFLNKPSTKFNPEGVYSTKVILSAEDAAPIIAKIDAYHKKTVAEVQSQLKGKKAKVASPPYTAEVNDQGEDTGRVIFAFKMPASYKDTPVKPALVDAKRNPTSAVIYSGSKIKVAGQMRGYYVAALGCGVSLRLQGVQVIELVTGGGSFDANSSFDEEEGYEAPPEIECKSDLPAEDNGDAEATVAPKVSVANATDF